MVNEKTAPTTAATTQVSNMQRYYAWHAKIYDLTRWSFLFGRRLMLETLGDYQLAPRTILEVGCGTGHNLQRLARRYPQAQLIGVDVAKSMLQKARRQTQRWQDRVQLIQQAYGSEATPWAGQLDIVLFSYALTMINPQWPQLLEQAYADLRPGGLIGVVDFHDSVRPWFKRHMANHHVRMDGHLLPILEQRFLPVVQEVHSAYANTWQYMLYLGQKPD